MRHMIVALIVFSSLGAATAAQAFNRVTSADDFLGLVQGKRLTRLGITLVVSRDGSISGRAFGRDVTGDWDWSSDGYFCREMNFGQRLIPRNCQEVLINGTTIRFIADEGAGDRADLQIR